MIDEVDGMRAEDFARMLPQGWRVELDVRGREKTVAATHAIYGRVHIGPKLRLVPADVEVLARRVRVLSRVSRVAEPDRAAPITGPFAREPELREWAWQQWQRLSAGEDCVDNRRIAEVGNTDDEAAYQRARESGCCGSCDVEVTHRATGRKFKIGFNYGH